MKKAIVMIMFATLFLILSINIMQMPSVSTTEALAYNEAIHYYYDNAVEETGAINVIASIITDYRAFDTLGETIVLFTSTVAVASILRVSDDKRKKEEIEEI